MAGFKRFVKSNKLRWIVVGVAIIGLTAGLIGLTARVSNNETTKKLGSSAYIIGLLDDETGKLPEEADKRGLSTDNFYKLDGLKIEVAKDAEIKYQVNYYDTDKNFLTVQTLTEDFNSADIPSLASTAKYVRIEIVPTEDDDNEVSWLEKSGYVGQLTVTVSK